MRAASALLIASLLSTSPAAGQCMEERVTDLEGAAQDTFGVSVSVGDGVALIGAYRDDDAAEDAGSVVVFRHDGADWVQEARLLPSGPTETDYFGSSVSISGNVAVIGAWKHGEAGQDSGAAYVFRHDGMAWVEETKLVASDTGAGDHFGQAVSISGDVIVAGASRGGIGGVRSGAAYVFRHDGSSWIEEAKLVASGAADADYFGSELSVSGDVVLIGASFASVVSSGSGAASFFRFDGSAWREEANITPPGLPSGAHFGSSVSVVGDLALVGAFRDGRTLEASGSVFVYRHDGASWVSEAKLLPSDAEELGQFGIAASLSGDVAVVGALPDGDSDGIGSAHVFGHDGIEWVEMSELTPSMSSRFDTFGASVSLFGEVALIGAAFDDARGLDAGAASFFDCSSLVPCSIPELSPPGLDLSTGAFRVRKAGADLQFSWEDTGRLTGLYEGTLPALHGFLGYDHRSSGSCRLEGIELTLSDSFAPASYFLAVASDCAVPGPRRDGPAGHDSSGRARPRSVSLGLQGCP